jgi:hypothetical protein
MDYFRENPAHLGWVMMHYNAIWTNGRIVGNQCEENPKYPIIDLREKFKLSEDDAGLIYDAWCKTGASMGGNFHDVAPRMDRMLKKYKTYDDWVAIKSDPQNEYASLWPTRDSIDHNLFLTGGCGMGWTSEGYIDYTGPSDNPESLFNGFSRAAESVRADIRKKIEDIIASPGLDWARDWIETGTLRAVVSKPMAVSLDFFDCGWARESLEKISADRHDEFYEGLKFVCHYEHLMDDIIPRWFDKDWEEATKSNTYDMYGYGLDLNKITLNTCYCVRSYVSAAGYQFDRKHNKEDAEWAAKAGVTETEMADMNKESQAKPLIECGFGGAFVDIEDIDTTSAEGAKSFADQFMARQALRGWDVIRLLKKKKAKRDAERDAEQEAENKKKGREKYSYIHLKHKSPYCRLVNFPDNAHESYVHGAIGYCERIASGGSDRYSEEDRADALKVADGLRKRFLEV